MVHKITKLLIAFVLFFLLFSCAPKIDSPVTGRGYEIFVASLSEYWDRLEAEALAWHPDAFLISVNVQVVVSSTRYPIIMAIYQSPTFTDEMLLLAVSSSSVITRNIEYYDQPVYKKEPILRTDWQIDSTKALDILLQDKDIEFLISHPETQWSFIELYRNPQISDNDVVWRLAILDRVDKSTSAMILYML